MTEPINSLPPNTPPHTMPRLLSQLLHKIAPTPHLIRIANRGDSKKDNALPPASLRKGEKEMRE